MLNLLLFITVVKCFIIRIMNVRAQINYWLAINQSDYNKLANEMTRLTGKHYTRGSINGKLIRNSLSVNELELIAKIFGYRMEFKEI